MPTSLFVAIEATGAVQTAPDEIRISVFGDRGMLFADQRLPAAGPLVPLGPTAMGTVTIYLPVRTGNARLDVRALSGGVVRLQGTRQVRVVEDCQTPVTVVLQTGALADSDRDGVPNPVDNCPTTANPDQSDLDADGAGDPCLAGAADGGASLDGGAGLIAIAEASSAAQIDLTAEGTLDWAHWGLSSAGSFDHKGTGGLKISDISPKAGLRTFVDPVTTVWSDGTPTVSASTNSSVYVPGAVAGFTLTAAAETTTRTLRLYAGGSNVDAQLTATLSDGSAPAATYVTTGRAGHGAYESPLEITFRSATPGQTLSLIWAPVGSGTIAIRSATLF